MPHDIERIKALDVRELFLNGTQVTASAADINGFAGGADSDDSMITASGVTQADLTKLHAATGAGLASGTKGAAITAPAGGTTIDTQARAAIASLIAAIQAFNITS